MSIRNLECSAYAALLFTSCWDASAGLMNYTGNGDISGSGALGTGSLELKDAGTWINATLTKGASSGTELRNMVFFIDSQPGGFNTTASFPWNGTLFESLVSGVYLGGTARATANFAPGFYADYALAVGPDPGGMLYHLIQSDAGPILEEVCSISFNPRVTRTAPTYTFSFGWADIGLTPNTPTNFFKFETVYANEFGGRYLESFESVSGTFTWGTLNFSNYNIYGVDPVPETTNAALLAFGGLFAGAGFLLRVRRKLRAV